MGIQISPSMLASDFANLAAEADASPTPTGSTST